MMWNPFDNKTVAVVGNAFSLFEKSQGELIDKNDVVCRFNLGNKIIDKKHQGERVDFAFFNVAGRYKYKDIISELGDGPLIVHASGFFRRKSKSVATHYIPLESIEDIKKAAGVDRPSSGFSALHYISQCNPKEINIFGFDFNYDHHPLHASHRASGPHDYRKEKEYIMNEGNKNVF